HPAGLHVVAERPGEVPLVRPAPSRARLAAGQSADDPALRAGEDSRGHGSWVDFHPAGLDPHAQRAAARSVDSGTLSVYAFMYPTGVPMPIAAANLRDAL